MSGDFDRARELATQGGELLHELGAAAIAARTSDVLSRIELLAGDAEAAEAKLRADFEVLTAMDENFVRPNIAALLSKALLELGRSDEAEELARVAEEIASPDDVEAQALLRSVRARILAARGRDAEARALAAEVLELVAATDAPVLRADSLLDLAEALESAPEERAAALEEARALYEQKRHLVGIARVEAELVVAPVS